MEKSGEIKKFILQIYTAMENADEEFFSNMLSQQDGLIMVGSDPQEWWNRHDNIVTIMKSHSNHASGLKIDAGSNFQAFREGTVGWFADQAVMRMPDGNTIPFRVTGVLHQENNEWKVVQWHASIGIPNEEAGIDSPDLTQIFSSNSSKYYKKSRV